MLITATPVNKNPFDEYSGLQYSQSHILVEVERLVNMITNAYTLKKHVKAINQGEPLFTEVFYQQLLCSLPRYLGVYQPHYRYSEHYEALIHACYQVGIMGDYEGIAYIYPADVYQMHPLVQHIAKFSSTLSFRRKESDRSYRQQQNYQRIVSFAYNMHQQYARLLVCRVDLGYLYSHQGLVTVDTLMFHLQSMCSLMSYRQGLFENLKGYIWAIEQGVDKGYHIHLMLYFDGRCHQNGWYMSDQVGQLWQTITGESGFYFNCHSNKAEYVAKNIYGLDMVFRDDAHACSNAINVAGYLARPDKTDQFLRCKPRHSRALGMAQLVS
jgi:hypothetical protein